MTMTQTIAFLRGALAVLVFAALTASAQAADVAVKISNFTFTPQQVTVKAGDTVTWTNEDDIPHTVTSKTMLFRSKALDSDDKFSFSFAKPASRYFCSLHPMMTGTIVVEAAAGKERAGPGVG